MEISLTNPLLWIVVYLIITAIRKFAASKRQGAQHNKLIEKAAVYKKGIDDEFDKFMKDHAKDIPNEHIKKSVGGCANLADLQSGLRDNKFTSVQLLMYYIERCYSYGRALNLVTQNNFAAAFEMAKQCDLVRQDPQKLKVALEQCEGDGLLYGVPVSFKDYIFLKGTRNTLGCINLLDYVHEEEGLLEIMIKKNGGIPFVKTNNPMLLLSMESYNRIYGRAMNPINHDRVPGGSSGGCAGLVCSDGTPLSIGSDIGGSIRCPSNFCGVYGFKGTPHRVSATCDI